LSSGKIKAFKFMANLGVDLNWATVTKIPHLLYLIIFIHHPTSYKKLNVM
jgi:hypothetical protein